MTVRLRVEFHCHTLASKDSLARIEDVLRVARERGVDRLVVTDHNTIRGALEAKKLDPERVIVGEEVLTRQGELLAFFVKEEVPARLQVEDAIRLLRQQGAFISVPHPFDLRRHGWPLPDLERVAPLVDAIEVFNSRIQVPALNQKALDFARSHNMACTVGSDAHTLAEVGRSTLLLPEFDSAAGLRQVIRHGVMTTRLSSPFIHLTSTFARYYKKLARLFG